jgi:transcriptional regulator with XRE-family HTH domain
MKKRILGKHFLKQWREYRGLSLERLANRMEVEPGGEQLISGMSLSRIERGLQPYSEDLLNALGHALGCEPYELLSVNPLLDAQVIDLMRFIHDLDRKKAEKALMILQAALG